MEVRHADDGDRPRILELLKEFHEEVAFSFSAGRMQALLSHLLSSRDGCCLVLGRPAVGLLMASVSHNIFSGEKTGQEVAWFVTASARGRAAFRMIDAFEEWAKARGCTATCIACHSGNDLTKLYTRLGYASLEAHFLKAL